MFANRKWAMPVALTLAVAMVLSACAPATPEVVEKEVVVTKEVVKEVEKEVLVTPTPPPPKEWRPLEEEEEVRIGVWYGFTGRQAPGSESKQQGLELAHKHRPEVKGVPVRLIYMDTRTQTDECPAAVSRLIERDKVHVLIGGGTSGETMAGQPVAEEKGIPNVCESCTNPLVTTNMRYSFATAYDDIFAGTKSAEWVAENLGYETVVLVNDFQSDYAVGVSRYFRDGFIERTGDPDAILGIYGAQRDQPDFTGMLTSIKALNPDFIHSTLKYKENVMAFNQAEELGIDIPWVGCERWWLPEFIEASGPACDGAIAITDYDYRAFTNPVAEKFVEACQEEYGKVPDHAVARAYAAYNMVLNAIEAADTLDPEAITEAMYNIDFVSVIGPIVQPPFKEDEDHNPPMPLVVRQVDYDAGEWVILDIMYPPGYEK